MKNKVYDFLIHWHKGILYCTNNSETLMDARDQVALSDHLYNRVPF